MAEDRPDNTAGAESLETVLLACLEAIEDGRPVDRASLAARHPEFADELAQFLDGHERLERCTAPVRAAWPGRPAEPSLGDYDLVEEIARGGMAVVWKARQRGLNRLVALKVVGLGVAEPRDALVRMRNEAEIVAALDHPHIAPVHEVGEHGDRLYLSMKLFQGGSLADHLGRFAAEPREAARMVATVARAVHHAHQRGVLHRDLKPSNVLLDAEGRPHVTDFGLAKWAEVDAGLTRTGAIVGTPGYMAPEQASGRRGAVTVAADVYGLGAVLYALLTGRPPFRGETVLETLELVRSREPDSPSGVNPRLDRDLETVCLKCLEKDPQRRYPSAEALAEDLERWLRGEAVLARRVGVAGRLWRWCRRNRALAAACVLTLTSLLAATAASVLLAVQRTQAAGRISRALATSEANRREAERRSADYALDKGLALCEEGEIGLGLLWLVRSLGLAESAEASDLAWTIRANLTAWGGHLNQLRAILDHGGPALAAAYDPGGEVLWTGSEDGQLRRWDARTARPLATARAGPGGVRALALSRDGRTLAALVAGPDNPWPPNYRGGYTNPLVRAAAGGTVVLWDAAAGRPLGPPRAEWGKALCLALSPDGGVAATGGADGAVRLWQTATGRALGEPLRLSKPVWTVAFSRDGRSVMAGSFAEELRAWEVATRNPLPLPRASSLKLWDVAPAPEARSLLIAGIDFRAHLLPAAGESTGLTAPHRAHVVAVAWSGDGNTFATGSHDYTARLWRTATGRALGQPLPYDRLVQSVSLSPDGRSALVGGWGKTVRLWDAEAGDSPGMRLLTHGPIRVAALSPDGRRLATADDHPAVQLWDLEKGRQVGTRMPLSGEAYRLLFSPDGKTLFAACQDGSIRLCDAQSGRFLRDLPLEKPVTLLAVHPTGASLVVRHNWIAQHRDLATGRLLGAPFGAPDATAAAFTPDGLLAIGGHDRVVQYHDLTTGQPVGRSIPHPEGVAGIVIRPDGRTVVTATVDGSVRRWDRSSGEPIGRPFQKATRGEPGITLSPDGRTFLLNAGGATAWLGDVATGRRLGPSLAHHGGSSTNPFHPDGRSFLTVDADNQTVHVRQVPAPLEGNVERLTCWLEVVTGMKLEDDGTAHVLDAEEWRERRRRLEELGGAPTPAGTRLRTK